MSFLKGCYSANGTVLKNGRIAYKTTCKTFAEQLFEAISEFGIKGYITTNKSKLVKFNNGEYLCKESYDVNIQKYESRINFINCIGFIQKYKQERLTKFLIESSPVCNVVDTKNVEKVYDFTEPTEHWGIVEGFIVHNCEILLPNKGLCNLVTINMCAFVKDSQLDINKLSEALKLNVRVSYRMACVDLELPEWDKVQKENMLLGCSFTGWQDAMNILKYTEKEQGELAETMRNILKQEAEEYAHALGRNKPKLVTTIKPEGTLSLLPTVSAGLHFSHSPYYVRRVRVNYLDPIVKVCEDLGWTLHSDPQNKSNVVIDFPCKAPKGKTIDSVSAIEQLEIYRMFMDSYVDHNASNTISVRDNEWDNVCDWVYSNWDNFVGISFLNLDNTFYPLAPYEKITGEEYNELIKDRKEFNPELLNKYIRGESKDEDLGSDCSSGACPIR